MNQHSLPSPDKKSPSLRVMNLQDQRLHAKHKNAIRRAFVQASAEIARGAWSQTDDQALDAATGWLDGLLDRAIVDEEMRT